MPFAQVVESLLHVRCQRNRKFLRWHRGILPYRPLFGLFAEIERDLIVERTKEGLAAVRARGKRLGRPKGARGKSKLDGKEDDIRRLLQKGVSKASIARIMEVSPTTLHHYVRTRKLQARMASPR